MKVVVFAPHNDDEVLGVGGTLAKHINNGDEVYVIVVTAGKDTKRLRNIQKEALAAHEVLGVKETVFIGLPVIELVHVPVKEINKRIADEIQAIKPQVVYLPYSGDMHIDHKVTTNSAMVALRPVDLPSIKEIYMYETLSETGWHTPTIDNTFIPNVWIDITSTFEQKIDAMQCYKSQLKEYPEPRSIEALEALAKYRGSTMKMKYAESFMLVRLLK